MGAAESLPGAWLRVVVSDDLIEGFAVCDARFEGDRSAFVEAIRAAGLAGPLDETGVDEFMARRPIGECVRVVRGRPPTRGAETKLEYVFASLEPRTAPAEGAAEREEFAIDHRESRMLERCNAGDVLVRKVTGGAAVDGVDAYGRTLPAERGREVKLSAGSNASLSEDGGSVVAGIDGVPLREPSGRIVVTPSVTVKNVDFKSGNIHFDGSVVVEGDVLQGFSVEATGDVHVKGSVEHALIRAGGSITIGGGVRRHSTVRAALDVDVRFCDSESVLEARRVLRVAQNALQCELHGDEGVVVGGQLVGGRVQSWASVEAGILGCPHGSQTVVNVERPNGALRVQALREELGLAAPAPAPADGGEARKAAIPSGIRPVAPPSSAKVLKRGPAPGALSRLPPPGMLPRATAKAPALLRQHGAPLAPKVAVRSKVTTLIERRELEQLLAHAERVVASPASAHGRVTARTAVRPGVTLSIAHDVLAIDSELGARTFYVGEEGIVEAPLAVAPPSSPKVGKQ
jgi:uncharacterized protein (DUF342 family)